MHRQGDVKADPSRRELHEEPTLYETEHAASAFGLLLASPEPQEGPSALSAPDARPTTPPAPQAPPAGSVSPPRPNDPWEEATRVPGIGHQATQTLLPVHRPPIEHALPAGAVTEMRQLPGPQASHGPPAGPRQRLLYPFVVGTLGGLLGLLIAMGGLQLVKQRREAQRRERLEILPLQQQVMDRAVRALLAGQRDEARELLQYYELRWPSPGLVQLLQSIDRLNAQPNGPTR